MIKEYTHQEKFIHFTDKCRPNIFNGIFVAIFKFQTLHDP